MDSEKSVSDSIQRAYSIPANNRTGTLMDVEHVVILMQENRSFDHYFGTLTGVRGFADRFTIPVPRGSSVWQQTTASGSHLTPYHLDGQMYNAQRAISTPHDWVDGQSAWGDGRLHEWPRYKRADSMGYYQQAEIPFHFALAQAFTLCDAYHCAMHAGTNGNRSFFFTGTNGPTGANVAFVKNEWDVLRDSILGYEWKTYAERLEQAGVSWISYQNMPDEWGDNLHCAFKQYRRANEASSNPVANNIDRSFRGYDPLKDNPGNPLYKGIANTMPGRNPDEYLASFKLDVKEGRLPQVSWVSAPKTYCEHPGSSSPVQGGWYIQALLDALTSFPQVWSKTVLIVTYDENDGFFDHIPSPSAPSPRADGKSFAGKTTLTDEQMAFEYFRQPKPPGSQGQPQPDGKVFGPGMRVPCFVISPWSRGGRVNSQVFDHTSILRFLEARFGVDEPNISPYRRAVCGDLTSVFDFAAPNDEIPTLDGCKSRAQADQLRSVQEKLDYTPVPQTPVMPPRPAGTRPSCALPYELYVSAELKPGEKGMQLYFVNHGETGAVLHVYDRLHLDRLPRRYMVGVGETLEDDWDVSGNPALYDLWVLGPNGFHRHFTGNATRLAESGAHPEVRVYYVADRLHVRLLNTGSQPCTVTLRPEAYRNDSPWAVRLESGQSAERVWSLDESGRWYDFSVSSDTDSAFSRRFSGRIETGRSSISDPAMGA
ncbi:phosphocholine-specific phospholipase C [Pseudomonas sp. PMCC200344]|uniref:phosphocholine-specific phospholipase C n=1 Tax=Pseudomonas sp. PMCC200344 TaxID=3042028 RepID=UPI0024B39739|nr:phospholipase C, phosphocholine-specific [Pseudomonas sp. PMCC200344]